VGAKKKNPISSKDAIDVASFAPEKHPVELGSQNGEGEVTVLGDQK